MLETERNMLKALAKTGKEKMVACLGIMKLRSHYSIILCLYFYNFINLFLSEGGIEIEIKCSKTFHEHYCSFLIR